METHVGSIEANFKIFVCRAPAQFFRVRGNRKVSCLSTLEGALQSPGCPMLGFGGVKLGLI